MLNTFLFNSGVFNTMAPPSRYHYLFEGSYRSSAGIINRIIVIGKNDAGDFITGGDLESEELEATGERLDFRLLPEAGNQLQAESIASAILDRERLNAVAGFITIPPNCGVQLFDVISIEDAMNGNASILFRVREVEFSYNAVNGQYFQRLILGGI